jgi:hypothetical protein
MVVEASVAASIARPPAAARRVNIRPSLVVERRWQGRLVFDRALVISQEVFGAKDAFKVE